MELFYKDWGVGQPVLFSHAWALNADMWEAQMRFLAARGFRCIAYDRRGFGRSSKPWDGYHYDNFGDDLASLLHALDLTDVILVGCCMGGGDLVRYVTRHGSGRVDKMVLLGAALPFPMRAEDNPRGIEPLTFVDMHAAIEADRPEFIRNVHAKFFQTTGEGASLSQGMQLWIFEMAMQAAASALHGSLIAIAKTDFRPDLVKIDVPTLIVHGDADDVAPLDATSRRTADLISRSRLLVVEGAPHGLWFTHPDEVNASLMAFLQPTGHLYPH